MDIPANPSPASSPSATGGEPLTGTDELLFAHLSDPHLSSLDSVPWRKLANKRLLGYLSWRTGRRAEHRREVLDAVIADLRQFHPDHLVITGDLTHVGLPCEFREVERWLHGIGSADTITVIPGNHDMYVREAWDGTFAHWLPFMSSDQHSPGFGGTPDGALARTLFPSLRVRGAVAFIGVSSARPSAPLLATGSMGHEQLRRLERILEDCRRRRLFRVLMLHHPPQGGAVTWRKRLTDAHRLRQLVAEHGVELVLHGHAHQGRREEFPVPGGRQVPVFGVASASAVGQRAGEHARYHLHRVVREADGWRLTTRVRGYAGIGKPFVDEAEYDDLIRV